PGVSRPAGSEPQSPWLAAHERRVVVGGFLLGLLIRLALVASKGTADMDTYLAWGRRTLTLGLPKAYTGIYFPVSFQLFALVARVADVTGLSGVTAIKVSTIVFDAATFSILVLLLH